MWVSADLRKAWRGYGAAQVLTTDAIDTFKRMVGFFAEENSVREWLDEINLGRHADKLEVCMSIAILVHNIYNTYTSSQYCVRVNDMYPFWCSTEHFFQKLLL